MSRKAILACVVALFISLVVCQVGFAADTPSAPSTNIIKAMGTQVTSSTNIQYGRITAASASIGFSPAYTTTPTVLVTVEGKYPGVSAQILDNTTGFFDFLMSDYQAHTVDWIAIGT